LATQIPSRKDPEANRAAVMRVNAEMERQARDGHDGSMVAHPDLVPVAMKAYNELMPTSNQLYVSRDDVAVSRKELLEVPEGTRTAAGFRDNIRVGIHYIEAWLGGRGAVPIDGVMEDAATAEVARAQIWQWLKSGAKLDDGTRTTPAFFDKCLGEEMKRIKEEVGAENFAHGRFKEAAALFKALSTSKAFEAFFTIPACKKLL
jgi:malate synthase